MDERKDVSRMDILLGSIAIVYLFPAFGTAFYRSALFWICVFEDGFLMCGEFFIW